MSFGLNKIIDNAISELRKDFSGTDEEFNLKIQSKLPELVQILGDTFKSTLIKQYKEKILKDLKRQEQNYTNNLLEDYKDAFQHLQIFIDLNKYSGKRTLEELEKDSKHYDSLKYHFLFRIQSRACQITSEIQTLLKNGYPDGAQARWRTLHELSVIFLVLKDASNELIEMYKEFDVIEKVKRARDFEEQRHKINWPSLDKDKMEELLSKKDKLLKKYGKEFGKSYGWTLSILPSGKRNFRELEKLAELDYMRPFYSWSNDNIHSGVSGIISRLGQIEDGRTSYLRFAGPSYYGMADPAQFTVTSLRTITSELLNFHYDLENQILDSLLLDLDDNIKSYFFATNEKFKKTYFEKKSAHNN